MALLLRGSATASVPGPWEKRHFGDDAVVGEGQGPSLTTMSVVVWGGKIEGGPGGRIGVGGAGSMVQRRDTFVIYSFHVLAMSVR